MGDNQTNSLVEIWKPIDGYSSYEISNLGNVKNKKTGKILKPGLSGNGYYTVSLWKNGKAHTKYIHELLAYSFIGVKKKGFTVNHIDGNKLNNDLSNLEIITYRDNLLHAYEHGLNTHRKKVQIVETGEIFNSLKECADAIDGSSANIVNCLNGKLKHYKGLHFKEVNEENNEEVSAKSFLYPHQKEALKRMFDGCVLNGSVGSGKSRTGIYYYFSKYGGSIENQKYTPMRKNPPDLYIFTTAKKKHDMEWEEELVPFMLYPDKDTKRTELYGNRVIIESWNCIKKHADIKNCFVIFDENKINGKGAWAKTFLKIAKNNEWILLSATNGDRWEDYETLFVAEGFFRTRSEFRDAHLNYSRYTSYPQVTGYRNEQRLFRLRDRILIDMDFKRHTVPHHKDVYVRYDISKYKDAMRKRWDPFKNEPITQASGLCYVLRKIVNEDESRQVALLEILEDFPKAIIFYNFDSELDILLNLGYQAGTEIAQYNGHKHEAIPKSDRWVYLVNYNACEAWNTTSTNCMIFYSQNYSYKTMTQAAGRIDRLTSPYTDLFYFHLRSRSGIDLAISRALSQKKDFNARRFINW